METGGFYVNGTLKSEYTVKKLQHRNGVIFKRVIVRELDNGEKAKDTYYSAHNKITEETEHFCNYLTARYWLNHGTSLRDDIVSAGYKTHYIDGDMVQYFRPINSERYIYITVKEKSGYAIIGVYRGMPGDLLDPIHETDGSFREIVERAKLMAVAAGGDAYGT